MHLQSSSMVVHFLFYLIDCDPVNPDEVEWQIEQQNHVLTSGGSPHFSGVLSWLYQIRFDNFS